MIFFTSRENRHEPRYSVHIPGRVELGGESIDVALTNVSRSGFKLICPRRLVLAMAPAIERPDQRVKLRIPVVFEPEHGAGEIRVECAILYVRRQAQDAYLLGCRITDYQEEDGQVQLQDYVSGLAGAAS